jgi:hypothetical protein
MALGGGVPLVLLQAPTPKTANGIISAANQGRHKR